MKTHLDYIKDIQRDIWDIDPNYVLSDKEIIQIVKLAEQHEIVVRSIIGYSRNELADIICNPLITPLELLPQIFEMKRRWKFYEHG